jgi:hypothetical protein
MIRFTLTERGFILGEFTDRYGMSCSLQESSLAEEAAVWLGTEGQVSFLRPSKGWERLTAEDLSASVLGNGDTTLIHSRMHLTQEMVKELLPHLEFFVEHGRLPQITDTGVIDKPTE